MKTKIFRPPKRKSKRGRFYAILAIAFVFLSCFYGKIDIANGFKFYPDIACAEDESEKELEKQLGDEIDK